METMYMIRAILFDQSHQFAPRALKAIRNSLTAVAASSKFKAEIAHLACFCASAIECSSSLKGP
jgi:hypothetical protein